LARIQADFANHGKVFGGNLWIRNVDGERVFCERLSRSITTGL
jgi:hypothetical protein